MGEIKELGYNEAGMKQAGKRLIKFFSVIGVIFGILLMLFGLTITGLSISAVCSYIFIALK